MLGRMLRFGCQLRLMWRAGTRLGMLLLLLRLTAGCGYQWRRWWRWRWWDCQRRRRLIYQLIVTHQLLLLLIIIIIIITPRQCLWCFHHGRAIATVHKVHLMNVEGAKHLPTQDQARRLRLWVRLYRLPESTPTIAIYYPLKTERVYRWTQSRSLSATAEVLV